MSLLVDPLAALFRAEFSNIAPLVLDAIEVEVELLPPLARIVITRRFTNQIDSLLEAVLTLPPAAKGEVIYGLTVTINGTAYRAKAQPAARAQRFHHDALLEGRRAILHELLANIAQLVSIAGIEAGAQVAVCIESIRPLDRLDDESATLPIRLTSNPRQVNRHLSDADALLTSPYAHGATLTVFAKGLRVTLQNPQRLVTSGVSLPIHCAEPFTLGISSLGNASLDRSSCNVELRGGWEASSHPAAKSLSLPSHPNEKVTRNRADWMFGRMDTAKHEIRVTAPMPDESEEALSPNARAMSAFAASALTAAARSYDPDAICQAANILTGERHLVFIGQDGELPDEIPVLRKLALPETAANGGEFESLSMAFEPQAELEEDAVPSVDLEPLPEDRRLMPGANPPYARPPSYAWLNWVSGGLFLIWILGALQYLPVPLRLVLGVFVILMLLNAVRYFPGAGAPIRRRLPILAALALPWIISILYGPLGLVDLSASTAQRSSMIEVQWSLLAASAIFPLLFLPFMRGGRGFTIIVGILNFVTTFFVTSTAIIINLPGS